MAPVREFCDLLKRLSFFEQPNAETVCELFQDFRLQVIREVPIISLLFSGTEKETDGYFILVDARQNKVDSASGKGSSEPDVSTSTLETGLDVTGSPLRCPFDEEILKYTEDSMSSQQDAVSLRKGSIIPVEPHRARFLASVYNQSCDYWLKNNTLNERFSFNPVWIMCNGNDSNKTIALGCHWNGTKLGRSIVSCSGQIKHRSDIMKIELLRKKHLLGLPGTPVDAQVVASYIVKDFSVLIPNDCPGEILPSSIFLQAKWKKCYNVLECPPSDAQCTVTITGKPECEQSLTHSMCEELERVQELINRKTTSTALCDPISTDSALIAKIEQLIEEARYTPLVSSRLQTVSEESVVSQSEKNILSYVSRRPLDFYDKLWNTLKDIGNTSDLAKCFELVFMAAKQKKLLKVPKRTTTTVAKIVAGKSHVPNLIDFVPLELLIEVGIEKLRKDCFYFFAASETATEQQLKPYLDHEFSPSHSLLCLHKMNYIIEVVMTASLSLKLQDNILRAYTKNILQHFAGNDVGVAFEYRINPTVVESWLKGDPENWKLVFTSTHNTIVKSTILHLSPHPLAEWISTADSCASGFFQTILTEIADEVLT